jgi:tRNA G10  N-methylase Trm11
MDSKLFLLRFVQQHPAFRISELEACAILSKSNSPLPLKFFEYSERSPVALVELRDEKTAASLVQRSILAQYPL